MVIGCHEDVERLERGIVAEYKQDAKGHKERLMQNHRVRTMLEQLQEKAKRLVGPGKAPKLPEG